MGKVDTRSTQTQSRVSFMLGTNKRLESRKRLVGSCIERAGYDSFSKRVRVDKGLEEGDIALELFLFAGKDGTTAKEKFGAQETNALSACFASGTSALEITDVGKNLDGDTIGSGTWAAAPMSQVLRPACGAFLVLTMHREMNFMLLFFIKGKIEQSLRAIDGNLLAIMKRI